MSADPVLSPHERRRTDMGDLTRDEKDEAACDWSDYRKDYGVSADDMGVAHKAFLAGWKAGRHGEQSGVLR